jgi:type II secretory pathway component PulC
MSRAELTSVLVLVLAGCREAAEAVDVDVDEVEKVARRTGDRALEGIEVAKDKMIEAGSEIRDAAERSSRPAPVEPETADALTREATTAIACPSPDRCTITQDYLARLRANPGFVARQARAVPHRPDGPPSGLVISSLESLPMQLGFREGDIIHTINSLRVDSLTTAPQLYVQLESARRFVVVFERDGERLVVEIDVV